MTTLFEHVFERLEKEFGAVLVVSKGGNHVTTLHTERGFYPSTNTSDGVIGRFFDSTNADSTVGLDAGR